MSLIKYTLTRNVKAPVRGTVEAAGIHFFVPYLDAQFAYDMLNKNPNANVKYEIRDDDLYITILPGGRVLIPSGVRVLFDVGSAMIASNKSGVSAKKGLVFTSQIVDSDYDGEIHIGVVNTSDVAVTVKTGEKLIQFVHTPVILSKLEEATSQEVTEGHKDSQRGAKGFGEGTGEN